MPGTRSSSRSLRESTGRRRGRGTAGDVGALVAARIDRLAPADRALLRWASVLGPSFSGSLVADVLVGDPSAAADSEAWDRLVEFVERDPDVPGGFDSGTR